ncbi:monovalent cation:proton antiporter, putative [Ricinus communis]|uniref:Monovalent cation:proton antiporter, putative n=1 Tax=Ricinus communis TaxID=3988 RepID=B9SL26_RICCO|nr:monovalent cation:proton antiporter, putative [Ricinus communis]
MKNPWMNQKTNISVLCEEVSLTNTMQFRHGKDPSEWPWQLVMTQIALVNTFKILFQLILKPFGQQTYIPQIMGGIALGPSFLSQSEFFYKLFMQSPKGLLMIGILRAMGFMFLLYLLSMRIDITIIKKCGKLAVVIGISSLVVPMIITTLFAYFLRKFIKFDDGLSNSLPSVAILVATTSFHVILVVLTDLKLLNSELGRLALASSMISGISSWAFLAVIYDVKEGLQVGIKVGLVFAQLSKFIVILIIVFIFRPIMLWMVRQTPDGKPLKEPFVCSIFPCYVIDAGRRANIFLLGSDKFGTIQLVMLVASFSKLASVIIPAYYFNMPLSDALSLGFILNCKGLFDVQLYSRANKVKLITNENYAVLVYSSALHAGLFSWLTRLVYDPSRRYVAYRKHTVQHSNERSSELRVLACIHQQDNVPSIVSVLEESNPSKDDPIGVYVMKLKRSAVGTIPLLIPHQPDIPLTPSYNKQTEINHIINAFSQIENRNEGLSMIQYFTSYAPHPTLHDAVCSMALEKTISLIILPFLHSDDPSTRIVNKSILRNAPCSVSILLDSGKLTRSVLPIQALKRVCLVFLGGPDDRETLAYGARMAMNPYTELTLIRLISDDQSDADLIEKRRDLNMINEFKLRTIDSRNRVKFKEYVILEGSETAKLLRSVCKKFELILVGRRHDPASSLLSGLTEWKEIEELGVVGDMLASKDFDCNALVLVIQQQASVVQEMIESTRNISTRSSISDMCSSKYASSRYS